MITADLPQVGAVAAVVHPSFPEDAAVFEERLRLYPEGCRVFARDDAVEGYIISHPWHDAAPPALNRLLGELPPKPSTYYIHDLALTPAARGAGAGANIVAALIAQARRAGLPRLALVAVNASQDYWRRHGFRATDSLGVEKLASYGKSASFMVLEVPAD